VSPQRIFTCRCPASWTPLAFLAKEGYEPQYGARPLRRAIQKRLLDPLALAILDGHFHEGAAIRVSVNKEKTGLEFR
jgi:ATP-dependent Clp protease ATP-binding subunit ClpB